MSKNKSQKTPPFWASTKPTSTGWFAVYDDMLLNDAFIRLSNATKVVYFYCLVQTVEKKARASLIKHAEEFGTEIDRGQFRYFVFPAAHCSRVGMHRQNVARCLKELEDSGFIEVVERNGFRRRENVYRLSSKWKDSG